MFPGLDLHFIDPAQNLITAVEDLDDLDRDLLDLSVQRVWIVVPTSPRVNL